MPLVNRVARLFKADLNAVLDHIEEPEQLLKQAIRDMEDELAANERCIAACAQDQELFAVRCKELESSIEQLDEQLDLCIKSGKDELARPIIRKKLEAERLRKQLDARCESNQRLLGEQCSMRDDNGVVLDGLRQKAEMFTHQASGGGSRSEFDDITWMSRELRVGDEEVEIALLREKASRGDA